MELTSKRKHKRFVNAKCVESFTASEFYSRNPLSASQILDDEDEQEGGERAHEEATRDGERAEHSCDRLVSVSHSPARRKAAIENMKLRGKIEVE